MSLIPRKFTRSELIAGAAREFPGIELVSDAVWADHTSLGAGSGTFLYARVTDPGVALEFLRYILSAGWIARPLGAGTNLVGSDEPTDGTVYLKPSGVLSEVSCSDDGICTAGAGAKLAAVLNEALKHGFGGAAGLCGIPGSIGGGLHMNAGANGQTISDFLLDMTLLNLETASVSVVPKNAYLWRYRDSGIPENIMVMSARFRFRPIDPATEKAAMDAEHERRRKSPQGRSAGSIFRNPAPELYAGRLLESAGMKGKRSGAFVVSPLHANWIVRDASPSPELLEHSGHDCYELIRVMRSAVFRHSNIILQPEVKSINMKEQAAAMCQQTPLDILVLMGGDSSEREISLQSAANVANALRDAGHNVTTYDITKPEITDRMRAADVVYPVLHGGFGEDGTIQALMEQAGIPFVGGSAEACRIVMDKFESKRVMDQAGIRNAAYAMIDDPGAEIPAGMKFPLIVKPNSEGSTFGLSLVRDASEWKFAISNALKYDKNVLVEEFIAGTEATVGVVLGEVYPVIEIQHPGTLYDYDAKYTHAQGETKYYCPPLTIDQAVQKEIAAAALKFAQAVGNTTLIRIDVIVRDSDKAVFMLEGNSLPGFTASSLLPKSIAVAGRTSAEVCSALAYAAYGHGKKA